jgi:hypothetical protein
MPSYLVGTQPCSAGTVPVCVSIGRPMSETARFDLITIRLSLPYFIVPSAFSCNLSGVFLTLDLGII